MCNAAATLRVVAVFTNGFPSLSPPGQNPSFTNSFRLPEISGNPAVI